MFYANMFGSITMGLNTRDLVALINCTFKIFTSFGFLHAKQLLTSMIKLSPC